TTMSCLDESKINETFFAASLQNVWFDTIQNLLNCFGIIPLEDEGGHLKTALNEIVDNRNAVAHGRIAAEIIGERHRFDVLRERTDCVNNILDGLIAKYESYILNLAFIKPEHHPIYSSRLSTFTTPTP
ncbi:HEPN domain-containing protein, partial [Aliivibrio sp. S3MY1]|uniref:HEPN domain-containing protein n=2 Tax=unclassified Aliivibrio TaxID=2645654 RepID=UPI002378A212